MSFLYLLYGRFRSLKFGIFPCVMLLFATVRTLFSGEAVMYTGLCMAFLPFFSQQSSTTCFAVDVSEEKEMLSTYLMDYILMFIGLGYLYVLTIIGENYVPGYVVNDLQTETFLLVLLCNLVFINILVPLTYALDSIQRLTLGCLLCLVEMAFMIFAMFALRTMGDAFVLTDQIWLYTLMLLIPMTTIEFTVWRWWQRKRYMNEDAKKEHGELIEIAKNTFSSKANDK